MSAVKETNTKTGKPEELSDKDLDAVSGGGLHKAPLGKHDEGKHNQGKHNEGKHNLGKHNS